MEMRVSGLRRTHPPARFLDQTTGEQGAQDTSVEVVNRHCAGLANEVAKHLLLAFAQIIRSHHPQPPPDRSRIFLARHALPGRRRTDAPTTLHDQVQSEKRSQHPSIDFRCQDGSTAADSAENFELMGL